MICLKMMLCTLLFELIFQQLKQMARSRDVLIVTILLYFHFI
jgi:hypothetical protein